MIQAFRQSNGSVAELNLNSETMSDLKAIIAGASDAGFRPLF